MSSYLVAVVLAIVGVVFLLDDQVVIGLGFVLWANNIMWRAQMRAEIVHILHDTRILFDSDEEGRQP